MSQKERPILKVLLERKTFLLKKPLISKVYSKNPGLDRFGILVANPKEARTMRRGIVTVAVGGFVTALTIATFLPRALERIPTPTTPTE